MNAPTLSLSERAMLATLTIRMWSARKLDKRITADVAQQHQTTEQAGRYNKRLLPVDAPTYAAVQTKAGELRAYHYKHTLPWSQDGARILTSAHFFEYVAAVRTLEGEFDAAVSAFVADYPQLRENARQLLNGMWRQEDYPTIEKLRDAFEIKREVFPLPSGEDFRVQLGDSQVAIIRQSIEANMQAAAADAMRDVWQRVHDAVSHMAERLQDGKAIFRDSLVGNLREIVNLLPALNLAQDAQLEATRQRLAGYLCTLEPDALRSDMRTRSDAAREAAEVARKMAAYMEA
jgi:hypothetical protein